MKILSKELQWYHAWIAKEMLLLLKKLCLTLSGSPFDGKVKSFPLSTFLMIYPYLDGIDDNEETALQRWGHQTDNKLYYKGKRLK